MDMDEKPIAVITAGSLGRWLFLGMPGAVFWVIGGLGASSLLAGLSNGSVVTGEGSSMLSLQMMWSFLMLCALGGVAIGAGSLVKPFKVRVLAINAFLGFTSLFFSVLT